MGTLVGVGNGPYPINFGNCFSLLDKDGYYWRVLNMNKENLDELGRRKIVKFPISVIELFSFGDYKNEAKKQDVYDNFKMRQFIRRGYVAIIDERIENEWLSNRVCTVCCPPHLKEDVEEYLRKEEVS